jgi:hypothetical protein
MKQTYRFRGNPEMAHNGDQRDFKNKEELLEMLGFCESGFEATECSQADEKKEVSVSPVGTQYVHHVSGFSEGMAHQILLTQEVR